MAHTNGMLSEIDHAKRSTEQLFIVMRLGRQMWVVGYRNVGIPLSQFLLWKSFGETVALLSAMAVVFATRSLHNVDALWAFQGEHRGN